MSNIVHPSDSHLPVRLDNDRDRASKNQSPSAQWAIAPAAALKVVLTFSQSPFNLPKKKNQKPRENTLPAVHPNHDKAPFHNTALSPTALLSSWLSGI